MPEDQDTAAPAHEPDRVSVRAVAGVAVGVALLIAGTLALVGPLGRRAEEAALERHEPPAAAADQTPPSQRLEVHPRDDLRAYEAEKRALLDTYARTESPGFARIPVERAIALIASRAKDNASTESNSGPPPRRVPSTAEHRGITDQSGCQAARGCEARGRSQGRP